jgi:signal peptidase I
MQYDYVVKTNGTAINSKRLEELHIAEADRNAYSSEQYLLPLTDENAKKLEAFANVISVNKTLETPGRKDGSILPMNSTFDWNVDNFGPIKIPAKGATVQLNATNLPLYKRIIEIYEENELVVNGDVIKINGEVANSYTFKMDYYWMMGDNRHNSADSRYWGFVPEDHVVGKAKFIWLSLDKDRSFPSNIRFSRLFSKVR